MLRLLLRSSFRLSIVLDHSCATPLRLLHDKVVKNLCPSVSDATVSYLVGSYGLSPTEALSIAKKFTFKTTDAADSLLSLLKSHGFTQLQIAHIATALPELLTYNSENKVKPKLEFLLNVGYSSGNITKIVTNNPQILCFSLENRLRPNFHMLKDTLDTDKEFSTTIWNPFHLLTVSLELIMLPNMKTLRDSGVPQHNILKMIAHYPKATKKNPSLFKQDVAFLQEVGFDVSNPMFVQGIGALSVLTQSLWNKKLELYKSFGWPEEETLTAFRKDPLCMSHSEEKIKQNMAFFVEKVKFEPSYVARRPILLSFSFEKRISPRYKIFCLLESKGLKTTKNFSTFLMVTENEFINRYITKHVYQVPEVLEIYKGKEDQ